jgi:hypothetical protein
MDANYQLDEYRADQSPAGSLRSTPAKSTDVPLMHRMQASSMYYVCQELLK